MYLVKLGFASNEDGIYTYEEETASDFEWATKKYQRMLNRWYTILNERGKINATLDDIEKILYSLNTKDNGKQNFKIEVYQQTNQIKKIAP